MSENTNTSVAHDTDDLDLFSSEFFGQNKGQPVEATPEEDIDQEVDESDAQDTETHDGDNDDTPESSDSDTEEADEQADEPDPKPKKNRFQERIDELTAKAREAERERDAVLARLEKLEQKDEPTKAPAQVAEKSTGPSPDDLKEDGSEKYPLGEFDPGYIRDLTRFTLNEEREAIKAEEREQETLRDMEAQKQALENSWNEKLGPAQERYPDFREVGENLISTFDGIDQAYGEYLASTIMDMEFGPDVLYYLGNNIEEAERIVKSGATKATIALGRLETKFASLNDDKEKTRPKITSAPVPPPTNKGSAVSKVTVAPDTDDLDAFESQFFAKKRRS